MGQQVSEEIAALLREMEESLLRTSVRKDEPAVRDMLAEEFREFGSSGRVFTLEEIVEALRQESPREILMLDFRAAMLAAGVALVTYRTIRTEPGRAPLEALRSSIWVERDGRWQMVFHQGTKTEGAG